MALNVLVTFATRHSGTGSLAEEIGSALEHRLDAAGLPAFVDVVPVERVASVERYDAVVVGSAVYFGRWLAGARRFVIRNAAALITRPVWLFSSGPVGDPREPAEQPRDVADLVPLIEARGHRVFAGRLDRRSLRLAERIVVRLIKAPYRDDRDFADVRAWAADVADAIVTGVRETAGTGREPR